MYTKLYPELLLLADDTERKRLLRDASRNVKHRGWYFAIFVVGTIFIVSAIQYIGRHLGAQFFTLSPLAFKAVCAALLGGLLGLGLQRLFYKPLRQQVRRELIAHGIPVCLHCGYNLTGLNEPRCPECGTSFDPHESAA